MATCPYIVRRGNRYYFRIRIPAEAVAVVGKTELKRSLQTGDLSEARRRSSRLMAIASRLVSLARMRPVISDEAILELVRNFYEHQLDIDHVSRVHGRQFPEFVEEQKLAIQNRDATIEQLQKNLADGCLDAVDANARYLLIRGGHVADGQEIDPNDEGFRELCHWLLRALLEATKRAKEKDQGIWDGKSTDEVFKGLESGGKSPAPRFLDSGMGSRSITGGEDTRDVEENEDDASRNAKRRAAMPPTEYVDLVIAEKQKVGIAADTANQYRYVMRVFEDLCSSMPISKYRTHHITYFRDQLLKLPIRANELECDSLEKAITWNESQPRGKRRRTLSIRSITDKYLTYIRSVFGHAYRNHLIRENIAEDITVDAPRNYKKRLQKLNARQAFPTDSLKIIFSQPLFLGALSPYRLYTSGAYFDWTWRFWCPLFMLFAGVRPKELGQLETADVIERCGYPCLNITALSNPGNPHGATADDENDDGGEEQDDNEIGKSAKTPASFREIPIHPFLQGLGFLDRVKASETAGERRVFPEWPPTDGKYSNTSNRFFNGKGKEHIGFLARIGVKTAKTPLYSLRHNFKQAMKKCGFQDSEMDLLMGHADPSVSAIYDSPEAYGLLIEKMKRLAYEGLDFDPIFKARSGDGC